MSACNDERRPGEGRESLSSLMRRIHSATGRRQTPVWHPPAEVGKAPGKVQPRLVQLVCCPSVRLMHLHEARAVLRHHSHRSLRGAVRAVDWAAVAPRATHAELTARRAT